MPALKHLNGGDPMISCPSITTLPESALRNPETMLSSVDFPAPFGPMRLVTWPSSAFMLTSSSTRFPPKLLLTFLTSSIAMLRYSSRYLPMMPCGLNSMRKKRSAPHVIVVMPPVFSPGMTGKNEM